MAHQTQTREITLTFMHRLSIPWHTPCITHQDFDVPLPTVEFEPAMATQGNKGIAPCFPVDYHIFMIRVSSINERFRRNLRFSQQPLLEIVQKIDNELAEIISTLPSHLHPDEPQNDYTARRDEAYPWIPWQRKYLKLVLLYHRMVVNRTLQRSWLVEQERYCGPRAICLSSARSILLIQREWTTPLTKRRQW